MQCLQLLHVYSSMTIQICIAVVNLTHYSLRSIGAISVYPITKDHIILMII